MTQLIVPLCAEATGWTVVIDGIVYRPALVDSSGRQIVTLDVDADDLRLGNENYSTTQTNNELIAAPGAGIQIYVTGIFFSTAVAGNFSLTQSAGSPATIFGPHYFPINGGISAPTLSAPIELNANSALRVTTSITGNHTITVLAKVA